MAASTGVTTPNPWPCFETRRFAALLSMRLELRTLRAGIDPVFDQLAEPFLAAWRGLAARARAPAPADEIVVREVLVQEREVAPAIACGIFHLRADLADRLAFPCHLD